MSVAGFKTKKARQIALDPDFADLSEVQKQDRVKRHKALKGKAAEAEETQSEFNKRQTDLEALKKSIHSKNREKYIALAALFQHHFGGAGNPVQIGVFLDPIILHDPYWFHPDKPKDLPLVSNVSKDDAGNACIDVQFNGTLFEFGNEHALSVANDDENLRVIDAFYLTSAARSNENMRGQALVIEGSDYNKYMLYLFSLNEGQIFGDKYDLDVENAAEIIALENTNPEAVKLAKKNYKSFVKERGLKKPAIGRNAERSKLFESTVQEVESRRKKLSGAFNKEVKSKTVAGFDLEEDERSPTSPQPNDPDNSEASTVDKSDQDIEDVEARGVSSSDPVEKSSTPPPLPEKPAKKVDFVTESRSQSKRRTFCASRYICGRLQH